MLTAKRNARPRTPRQQALLLSLQQRIAAARGREDADTIHALFREAVYLGIQPKFLDRDSGSAG